MFYRCLHQFLDQAVINASLSARRAGLRSVTVDSRTSVVNKGTDAACHLPATVARAVVSVVEEALVVSLFVLDGLWRRVEGVVYGAFEGRHVGEVEEMRLGERFGLMP